MIKKILISLTLIGLSLLPAHAEEQPAKHVIDLKSEAAIGNMSQVISLHGAIHMTGQPDQATLAALKDSGFDVVLNIRGKGELDFDEQAIVEGKGLAYYNVPLLKDGKIQDSAVTEIHDILKQNKGKKILFHCSSGNRVASWLGAHLARDLAYTSEQAISYAKQAGMTKDGMTKILQNYINNLTP